MATRRARLTLVAATLTALVGPAGCGGDPAVHTSPTSTATHAR